MRGSRASQRAKHHLLLVAAGELAHLLLDRGCADAEASRQRRHQPALRPAIEEAQARDLLRHAQGDVVAHAAQQQQRFLLAVLGHQADAGQDGVGRRAQRKRPAEDADLAAAQPVHAEGGARELGPAGADQPAQPDDLAGAHAAASSRGPSRW